MKTVSQVKKPVAVRLSLPSEEEIARVIQGVYGGTPGNVKSTLAARAVLALLKGEK